MLVCERGRNFAEIRLRSQATQYGTTAPWYTALLFETPTLATESPVKGYNKKGFKKNYVNWANFCLLPLKH